MASTSGFSAPSTSPTASMSATATHSVGKTAAQKEAERLKKLRDLQRRQTSGFSAASTSATATSSDEKTAAQKKAERMKKLRDLRLRQNEARKMNHAEVVEEDKRNKLPTNFEAKRKRAEWELEEQKKRAAAEARGEDYDRLKLLDVSAEDAEKWDRLKKKKKNPDQGFADYEQATFRQYNRLTKQLKPDMEKYEDVKGKIGEDMYPTVDSLPQHEYKDSQAGIDRMVDDLEKQISKRNKYSRRRAHNDEEDIDFINERNMNFNKKLERFYGKYTTEIKQNLERGTAV